MKRGADVPDRLVLAVGPRPPARLPLQPVVGIPVEIVVRGGPAGGTARPRERGSPPRLRPSWR